MYLSTRIVMAEPEENKSGPTRPPNPPGSALTRRNLDQLI